MSVRRLSACIGLIRGRPTGGAGRKSRPRCVSTGACLHSGLVAFVMYLLLPRKVSNVHNLVLFFVVLTLLVTEGRMDLGSKWCSYCLIYSFVYLNDCFLSEKDAKDIEKEMGDC